MTIKTLARLPKAGAVFFWALVQRAEVDLFTLAGVAFVTAGAWHYGEGAGRIVLGAFLILGGLIRSAKR